MVEAVGATEGLKVLLAPTSSSPVVGDNEIDGSKVGFSNCTGDGAWLALGAREVAVVSAPPPSSAIDGAPVCIVDGTMLLLLGAIEGTTDGTKDEIDAGVPSLA